MICMLQVKAFGETAYKTFRQNNLESDPPKVKFYYKITNLKV